MHQSILALPIPPPGTPPGICNISVPGGRALVLIKFTRGRALSSGWAFVSTGKATSYPGSYLAEVRAWVRNGFGVRVKLVRFRFLLT